MFTADKARTVSNHDLDERIKREVEESVRSGKTDGLLRVYSDDWFINSIEEELNKRGFHSVEVPKIILKGDVYFSWAEDADSDD